MRKNILSWFRPLLFLILCLLLCPGKALAWNATGHHVVAELAWRSLSKSDKSAAAKLLRQHPHYAILLATNVPPGVSPDEWAFLNAASWPDMVRPSRRGDSEKPESITKYHRSPWHYINTPFIPPNDPQKATLTFSIPPTNVIWALSNALAILGNKSLPAQDRAISLCWVLHLVGDLHQPLHAATLVNSDHPHGDQGGNLLGVTDASGITMNLHSFWDGLLGYGENYDTTSSLAESISSEFATRNLPEYGHNKAISLWAEESFAAAVSFAYLEGHLKYGEWGRGAETSGARAEAPRLSSSYLFNANDIARRRIALAGQRAADLLRKSL
jgi:hypothetical protein